METNNTALAQEDVSTSVMAASPWLTCFFVVKFDLEYGHKIEQRQPQVSLPQEEEKNIAFLSFPDCNTNNSSDSLFTFRTRKGDLRRGEFHHGYVYFRQQKDATSPRGYLQKSLVLLSPLLHAHFFKRVIKLVGYLYFKRGPEVLAAAVADILAWPEPEPGKAYELPLLGWVLRVQLPSPPPSPLFVVSPAPSPASASAPSASASSSSSSPLSSSSSSSPSSSSSSSSSSSPPRPSPSLPVPVPPKGYSYEGGDLFGGLGCALGHLWHLWELVLLNEPLVVEASDPSRTSDAVLALTQLILPLAYSGDFRPYFTIYDREYNEYARAHPECLPGAIIGVTNPHFSHVFAQWPHTLHIGDDAPRVLFRKEPGSSSSSSSSSLASSASSTTTTTSTTTSTSSTMRRMVQPTRARSATTSTSRHNGGPDPDNRSYSDPALVDPTAGYSDDDNDDGHRHDDGDDGDDHHEDDNDDGRAGRRPRQGSKPIAIAAATSPRAEKGPGHTTSHSFGGTRSVLEVIREKMSLRPSLSSSSSSSSASSSAAASSGGKGSRTPDGRSGATGRLSRTRSNSSGQLPGGSSPPARLPRVQLQRRPSTSVESKMKPLIVANKKVLRQLLEPGKPTAYYNELIRRHFHRLTQVFLRPLELYFASLVPAASTISPFRPPPRVAAFNEDHFLRSLGREAAGAFLTGSASGDAHLYHRFLRSQNYHGWLQRRETEAAAQLERWYLRAFLSAKVPPILRRKAEIEIVDFYLLFHDSMKKANETALLHVEQERVEACAEAILACLPTDLARSIVDQQKARAAHASTGGDEEGSGGESGDCYSD